MQMVAVGSLVAVVTGNNLWAALVAAAAFLPTGVLSPVGGALADRIDRRRFLVGANLVEAALAALLAVLTATGHTSPGLVTAVVLVAGCVTATSMPFVASLLPDLVPPEDLLGAVSLNSAQWNVGRVVGPALAAGVVALGSYSVAFAVNAASFGATIVAYSLLPLGRPAVTTAPERLWRRIADGARVARREPGCRAAIGLIAATALLAAPFIALIPAKAHALAGGGVGTHSRSTAAIAGALTTAQGVGAVAGALVLAGLAQRVGRRRLLVGAMLATPVALCAYAWSGSVAPAVASLALVGACYIAVLTGLTTVVQLQAPAAYRARVLSLSMVALGVLYGLGAPLQGAVADRIGLAGTTTAAAATFAALVLALAAFRPAVLHALDGPGAGRGELVALPQALGTTTAS
jgi:MFS family permease